MARENAENSAASGLEPEAAPGTEANDALRSDGAPSEVIVKAGPENRPIAATELLRTETGDVQSHTVTMERAGAEQVTAERVIMTNSGARTIDARSAQVDRSGVLAVNSEKAVFYNSSAIAVAAEEARIVRGRVFMVKADRAAFEGDAKIAIYVGPIGEARPLVDARGAAAFGAGLGAVAVVLGSLLRRLFRAS